MITIISGTNREGSNTLKVSLEYQRLLKLKNKDSRILCLAETVMTERNSSFIATESSMLKTADKFIIVMPEYNGSYPGILKLMIDNTDVPNVWYHKKVLLTGVSTGRAGNLRGMEHLTGSLLHMKMLVHPNRLPISMVNKLMNDDDQFSDAEALFSIQKQLNEFLEF